MSLRPDDRSSRNRDRSSTRRERSRSNVRIESPPRAYEDRAPPGSFGQEYEIRAPERPSVPYPDDEYEDFARRDYDDRRQNTRDDYDKHSNLDYGRQDDKYSRRDDDKYSRQDEDKYRRDDDKYSRRDDDKYSRREDDKYNRRDDDKYSRRVDDKYDKRGSRDDKYGRHDRHDDSDSDRSALAYSQSGRDDSRDEHARYQEIKPDDSYKYPIDRNDRPSNQRYGSSGYAAQEPYQYAKVSDKIKYTSKPQTGYEDDRKALVRTTSSSLTPAGLGPRMDRLSISGNRPDMHTITGGRPPASPLLEAYHGTYQSISPMPTAMRLDDDDIPSLDYVQPKRTEKKKVKLYDPEADAKALAKALNSSSVNTEVICDILPPLSDDQVWELRKEYKKQYKVQGKGINLSKLLKMKLSGNFGKIVYVTALGRWESEGYWANFFYQSHASRRELLIESLMGRTNAEIRSIKNDFKDKRYNDDLVRCMEKELKMDKFRTAILMSLEGRRQEEQDVYPHEYRAKDVENLQRAVRSREGGETAMLEIVVRRSDAHLRECLRLYESMYGDNFARAALKKSNNLVGEVIAHILNGVINKPARDALLLRHAIKDIANHNKDDELRYELLTSRLVRLHWDRLHMMRVKKEYKDKYGKYLEEDLENSTKGDFREFVCELCQVQGPK